MTSLKRSILRLVAASTIALACMSATGLAQSQVSVRGRVRISGLGGPVRDALVRFEPKRLGLRVERKTDGNGNFQADKIMPGLYTLTVECPGYEPLVMSVVEVRPSEDLKLDIPLSPVR